jgi:hypothetical protein
MDKHAKINTVLLAHPYLLDVVEEIDMDVYEELAIKYIMRFVPTDQETEKIKFPGEDFMKSLITKDALYHEYTKKYNVQKKKIDDGIARFKQLKIKTPTICEFAANHFTQLIEFFPPENITATMILRYLAAGYNNIHLPVHLFDDVNLFKELLDYNMEDKLAGFYYHANNSYTDPEDYKKFGEALNSMSPGLAEKLVALIKKNIFSC